MHIRDESLFLGIEGGGTRTIGLLAQQQPGRGLMALTRLEFGAGNLRLLNDEQLSALFAQVAAAFPRPASVGVGLAGARSETDRERISRAVRAAFGPVPTAITHDLRVALEACEQPARNKILVLSGTGSCCYGLSDGGGEAKIGGWGHILGDLGSGYHIALQGFQVAVSRFDRRGKLTLLARKLLRLLLLNDLEDLIGWIQNAGKSEIAAAAPLVFEAAAEGDADAEEILREAAQLLASDAVECARRLDSGAPLFVLSGSVLLQQPEFGERVTRLIKQRFPKSAILPQPREAVWGAVKLAAEAGAGVEKVERRSPRTAPIYVPLFEPALSPTEQRNPQTSRLSKLPPAVVVELMLREDAGIVPALQKVKRQITQAVTIAVETLRRGGRMFYVGAGTSGRLGVLDASECPPTFRASPETVQGIIAGGQRALWQAVEGAEDDARAGAQAMLSRGVKSKDFVIGIAASGRTPFVWGALAEARKRKAQTGLICFNPKLKIERQHRPDILIAADVGAEVLTGSTRLKCGTATKLILNMISTIAMVRVGKAISNLMVDLNPSNEKLRDRAIRIVRELTGATAEEARRALEESAWVVKSAYRALERKARR